LPPDELPLLDAGCIPLPCGCNAPEEDFARGPEELAGVVAEAEELLELTGAVYVPVGFASLVARPDFALLGDVPFAVGLAAAVFAEPAAGEAMAPGAVFVDAPPLAMALDEVDPGATT